MIGSDRPSYASTLLQVLRLVLHVTESSEDSKHSMGYQGS